MFKKIKEIKKYWIRSIGFIYLTLSSCLAFADGVIPISNNDETQSGHDFAETLMTIIQKDIMPVVEIGGAAVLLFVALNGLWSGYKEYQKTKEMDHLKGAVISSVILIVVGGAILYILDYIRTLKIT